jgi:hypothetical protein
LSEVPIKARGVAKAAGIGRRAGRLQFGFSGRTPTILRAGKRFLRAWERPSVAASLLHVPRAWNENELGVAQLTNSRHNISDDQISEVLQRGRFEDLSLIAVIACFAIVAALAVALQLGAPQNIFFPVTSVVVAILFVAIFAWMVGHFRNTRSLNRLEGPNRPHSPARAYVLPWLVAIVGGIA